MPTLFVYLFAMLAVILAWFVLFKRPIYEAIGVSFIVLLTMSGTWGQLGSFFNKAISTSLIYSMTAFVAMSIVLTETQVLDGCINIILAILGKVPGGAGYVSIIASSFMGALSGSGPANVMSTGAITIPAMKKSGFPAELAANIESNASYLGNMIPPSSNIVAAFGAYLALYPSTDMSVGQFWIVLWSISFWFIFQRMAMIYIFCKKYDIKPMNTEDVPDLRQALKENWQGMILPVIILFPFLLDYMFKETFFTARLGAAGADYMSSSLMIFIAGIATMYACLIVKDKKMVTPAGLAEMFEDAITSIAPTIGTCLIGYMVGAMFNTLDLSSEMELFIMSMDLNKFSMIVVICLMTCFLGMIIPGSSLTVIFGSAFITALASVGVNPLLAAAMLPCICGVMCGITPPLGLGMYAGMAIAESDFKKTFNNNLWWVAAQFILQIAVLMNWLPIFGI
ncbi:MAG: TRAP transporter large permease subunit [Oscillospiraceae bacterium]|nr:TRAP transporter large permease subunit [Oscillospiraceae bacterium]